MRNFSNNNRPESGADRIRKRLQELDDARYKHRFRISPFTFMSVAIILLFLIFSTTR